MKRETVYNWQRPRPVDPDVGPGQRRCKTCEDVKADTEFYWAVPGLRRKPHCKACERAKREAQR